MNKRITAIALAFAFAPALLAQPQPSLQDEYAVYDLLAPDTASFRTVYEVAVTTPGLTKFSDRIGSGLTPVTSGPDVTSAPNSVVDLMSGAPLKYAVTSTALAIELARAVPAEGGQARLRITQTYKDAKNYRRDGDGLIFDRPIGIRHVAIVLPAGYQVTDCNVPSQVLSEPDGRIRVTFMNQTPGAAPLTLKAKPGIPAGDAAKPRPLTNSRSWEPPAAQGPTERARLSERAHQDRDIVYFQQQPETSAFSLYHDYTSRVKAPTSTSTSCAPAAPCPTRRGEFSTPVSIYRQQVEFFLVNEAEVFTVRRPFDAADSCSRFCTVWRRGRSERIVRA